MLKRFIKRNFLIYSGMYIVIILTLKGILNIINIEFMSWVYFLSFNIIYICIVIGINQLIFKIHKKIVLKVILVLITLGIFYITGLISIVIQEFAYRPTHIIKKDNKKMVVIVDRWRHANLDYYNYITPFMRSRKYIEREYLNDNTDPFISNYEYSKYEKMSLANKILENYIEFLDNIYWFIRDE